MFTVYSDCAECAVKILKPNQPQPVHNSAYYILKQSDAFSSSFVVILRLV